MSNKTLLNEGTVRRFMKLAEIDSLANPFVDRINEQEEEEEVPGAPSAEEAGEQEPEMDVEMEPEMEPEIEPEMDVEMEPEEGPLVDLADEIKDVIVNKLQDMIDDGTLEIDQGLEADEVDLEDEEAGEDDLAGLSGEEGFGAGVATGRAEEPEEELAEADDPVGPMKKAMTPEVKACLDAGGMPWECYEKAKTKTNEANIVAEVARRVTKRLLASR